MCVICLSSFLSSFVTCLYFYLLSFNLHLLHVYIFICYLLIFICYSMFEDMNKNNNDHCRTLRMNERSILTSMHPFFFTIFGTRFQRTVALFVSDSITNCPLPLTSADHRNLTMLRHIPKASIRTKHPFHTRVHVSRSPLDVEDPNFRKDARLRKRLKSPRRCRNDIEVNIRNHLLNSLAIRLSGRLRIFDTWANGNLRWTALRLTQLFS